MREVLSKAWFPLGAHALLERPGFSGPSQVYRALQRLVALGLAHRLESPNAYIACPRHDASYRMAFAICDPCGHTDQLADGVLAQHLQRLAEGHDFELGRAVIEVHGKCAVCTTTSRANPC